MDTEPSDLIERARAFATRAHQRIDQRRKYSGQPYHVHLEAVAKRVASVTDDPETIAAAWLHDTVEDTEATFHDIEVAFGPRVARLVYELTDVSRPSDGNRSQRKALDREHLAHASARAQTVKLADLIDNVTDICAHDKRFARTWLLEMAALLEVLHRGHPILMDQARHLLEQCARKLGLGLETDAAPSPGHDYRKLLGFGQRRTERLFNEVFSARDIARPLISFDLDMAPEEILDAARHHHSPVAGLRSHGLVDAYLRRDDLERMGSDAPIRPIRSSQILAGDTSLPEVIQVLARHDYCFITTYGAINGLVSRAEMEQPLVRMWLFGMITMLEMRFTDLIRQRWPEEAWTDLISQGRLQKARALLAERQERGHDTDLLDCLQFADKGQLVVRDPDYRTQLNIESRTDGNRAIRELESLRNHLAHSQPITASDWTQVIRMAHLARGREGAE
ncbi:MAG: bifunctional (p)ppGpp synthetase/guanosine-3',5'-bis(diphosphate) 3'-pyrophosphohydrolase [Gammaproteobacteria bacterium]|nr:MAG: bifunctional (p)ppGpp synthetase/guanosine-3',5'-bis(diphosphate) 3'-pyrophosphohydrolase [Gammaproteobacteria bacterium]